MHPSDTKIQTSTSETNKQKSYHCFYFHLNSICASISVARCEPRLSLLGFRDHDGLQQLIQLVLDEVRQLTHSALVHLDHVQVQLELLRNGGVGGLAVRVLAGLARWGGEEEGERMDRRVSLVQCFINQCLSAPGLTDGFL